MVNLASHMVRAEKVHSTEAAVALGTDVLFTYNTLAKRVAAIASGLKSILNLKHGDRVGLMAKNCPEYLEILYAAWHAGLIIVPINAKLHSKESAFILEDCGAKVCFVSQGLAATITENISNVSIIAIGSPSYTELLSSSPIPVENVDGNAPAWIFYTSGTTGMPKGATLSHRNLLTMSYCHFTDVDPVSPWATLLHAAPMSHGSGLIALSYVIQGGCHVIPESGGFDVAEVYQLIKAWPHTAFFAAPTMVKRMLDYSEKTNTDNLKAIIYGGGPMYLEHCLAALERFGNKLTQLYGQGETPMTITALNAHQHSLKKHPQWRARMASVGVAQSAIDIRIANDEGSTLSTGEIGEVLVRGDTVMLGYWENPDATAATIKDGWLYTGDYGVLDEDGFLTLKDRSKDLIISGGTNIYPREIEEILLLHPNVSEISIIGREDEEWGEIVVAYIVTKHGANIDTSILDKLCIDNTARFKRPRDYCFVEKLPKNSYGKVLKKELRIIDQEKRE